MNAGELHETVRRQPFQPFRIVLTTGVTHDIRHPELMMVGPHSAILGLNSDPNGLMYERMLVIDVSHIVSIETLPQPSRSAGPPPSNN